MEHMPTVSGITFTGYTIKASTRKESRGEVIVQDLYYGKREKCLYIGQLDRVNA